MKRTSVLSAAFLLILTLALAIAPIAAASTQHGVQFELTTDKASYAAGDLIQVSLNVVNTNEQDLSISYEVILPDGLTLAEAGRGYLTVAAGGKADADFAVATAKGADGLPATGDGFPLEALAVLAVISGVGMAVFFRKTRFVAMLLLCVMLAGVALPAGTAAAEAEYEPLTPGAPADKVDNSGENVPYHSEVSAKESNPEDTLQEILENDLSEEAHDQQLADKELEILEAMPEEEMVLAEEIGKFEVSKNVQLDGQLETIAVKGVITTGAEDGQEAASKSLGPVGLKPITILGTTKFKLTWNRVPGATHYEVWHSAGNGYVKRATCIGTSWTTNYGAAGVINTYKVRAITKYGNYVYDRGPYSTRTCYGMAQPSMSAVAHTSSTSENVRVSWNRASYCSGYYVYRSLTGATGTYSLIGRTYSANATSFVDYYRNGYYKVRPYYTSSQTGITYSGPATGLKSMPTQYRALVIGQGYPGTNNALPGCITDGQAVFDMLNNTSGSLGYYRPADVKGWKNMTANKIKAEIKTTFQRAKANDVSYIYYSGHGLYMGYNNVNNGAWISNDNYYIPAGTLRQWMDEIPGKKIVIMDSCYSGNLIGKVYGSNETLKPKAIALDSDEIAKDYNTSFINNFTGNGQRANLAGSNYYVITAASGTQSSWEVGWYARRGGLFTINMVYGCGYSHSDMARLPRPYADASSFGNYDNDVTLNELYRYTEYAVQKAIREQGSSVRQNTQVYPTNSAQIVMGR